MKTKRFVSTLLALLLICSLPVSAFADTWYLENGDITVNATESGQTVTQGAQVDVPDSAPVITQSNSSTPTENTITIKAEENATANVTLEDVNIVVNDPNDGSGKAAVTIDVADGAEANVTLDGVKIDTEKTGGGTATDPVTGDEKENRGEAAVQIRGNGDVTIELDGENTLQGGQSRAGVEKNNGGSLTITDENETHGSLKASGGGNGSGIGGGLSGTGSDITVSGDAQVKAQGGSGAIVNPNTDALDEGWIATYAPGTTDLDAATPDSVTYKDASGMVQTATQNIQLEDALSATCTEAGHEAGFRIDGVLVAVTTPATDHNVPNGYTPQNDATCTTLGTKTGYCTNCQTNVTITDPNSSMKDHTFTTYTPDPGNLATCTNAGTKTAVCDDCGVATQTVTDPAKGHSFTNYISDNNATYDADGTKTAKCDHCDATHTISDPGSKLVWVEDAPLYRVIDQNGKALACKAEQKDGVLTITVDADFASLTGKLGGIQTLKAQGVDTIVFVTKGASSTFALSDLLSQGSAGDSYTLTHDGAAVTFTLNNGADAGTILQ